jgi:uncharacterized protein
VCECRSAVSPRTTPPPWQRMPGWGFPQRGWYTWEVGRHRVFRLRFGGDCGQQEWQLASSLTLSILTQRNSVTGSENVSPRERLIGRYPEKAMMPRKDADYWIEKLALEPHPEGGYYRQTYRAELTIDQAALPEGFPGARAASTAIYFLLKSGDFSAMHRLRSDELWHFYAGGALVVSVIDEGGRYSELLLGSGADAGEIFQAVVKAGNWFGARVQDASTFALVGCTVAPGFDFADFEMGKREELIRKFPRHRRVIERLTRE